ncbi:MAG: HNH endonuclease [Deltaproteobacteria bacterium]|nr:HNH endonuclease [Deltaproteobacteria bacterium]
MRGFGSLCTPAAGWLRTGTRRLWWRSRCAASSARWTPRRSDRGDDLPAHSGGGRRPGRRGSAGVATRAAPGVAARARYPTSYCTRSSGEPGAPEEHRGRAWWCSAWGRTSFARVSWTLGGPLRRDRPRGARELLRASHIKPWAECETDAERLDVFNGFLLEARIDAVFDQGFVTVADDGRVVVAAELGTDARAAGAE